MRYLDLVGRRFSGYPNGVDHPTITEEPEIPQDVIQEALDIFRSQIFFQKWTY